MEERLRFVSLVLDGESMSNVCRAFGITLKTGYKLFKRYREHGLEALSDRSRRPVRYANQLPMQVEVLIVRLKRDKMTKRAIESSKPGKTDFVLRDRHLSSFGCKISPCPASALMEQNMGFA